MKYPNKIKEYRTSRHLSLVKLEEMTGISAQQLNRLEKGERRWNEGNIRKIADAFKCNSAELIDNGSKGVDPIVTHHESELALIYVLKMILQILMQAQLVSPKGLDFNFSEALNFYNQRNLTNSAEIIEKFRVFVAEEPRVLEQAINRILLEPGAMRTVQEGLKG